VQGLSAITRCNKTIAQDGTAKGITLTVDDGYCLDGAVGRETFRQPGCLSETLWAFRPILANG
jgi:hypothetical protein